MAKFNRYIGAFPISGSETNSDNTAVNNEQHADKR